jgi:hypothetical protein
MPARSGADALHFPAKAVPMGEHGLRHQRGEALEGGSKLGNVVLP